MKKIIMIFILLISIKIIADTVNTDKLIIDKKINNIGRKLVPSLKYNATEKANENLWIITSEIINKTFEFYENKIKAKAKIKQLMELKSIGLLGTQHWRDLGFYTYENDIKSEIKVSDLLTTYNNIKSQYSEYLNTANSKKVFDVAGFNSLFLAKLLKKLDLQIVNGRILDKYNAIFIQKLFESGENINKYKEELLLQKDNLINNLSSNQINFLKKFFKMSTTLKLLDAIKTNGVNRTIPSFRSWLEDQSKGILKVFYQDFSDEYLAIIDRVLESASKDLKSNIKVLFPSTTAQEERLKLIEDFENQVAPIKQKLSDDYAVLFYNLSEDFQIYTDAYRVYNELEIIEIITHEENIDPLLGLKPEEEYLRKAQAIIELKEIDLTTFTNLVLNTPNLLYPDSKTNLYYLYNIYRENDIASVEGELEDLISSTIITIDGKNNNFDILNPNFEAL